MKNTKKMSPEFFANYLTLDVFPNLEEDYVIDTILLQKTKFQFATECPECHNYMLRGIKYDIPNFLKNVDIYSYFDTLFEDLDVVWKKDVIQCDCPESYAFDPEAPLPYWGDEDDDDDDESEYDKYNEDDDYSDGRCSIYDFYY